MPAHSGLSCQAALPARVVCRGHGSPSRGPAWSISFCSEGKKCFKIHHHGKKYTIFEENTKFPSILRQNKMPQEHFMLTVDTLPAPGDAFTLSCRSGALEGEFERPCWSCGQEGKDHHSLAEWIRGFGMVEVWCGGSKPQNQN